MRAVWFILGVSARCVMPSCVECPVLAGHSKSEADLWRPSLPVNLAADVAAFFAKWSRVSGFKQLQCVTWFYGPFWHAVQILTGQPWILCNGTSVKAFLNTTLEVLLYVHNVFLLSYLGQCYCTFYECGCFWRECHSCAMCTQYNVIDLSVRDFCFLAYNNHVTHILGTN